MHVGARFANKGRLGQPLSVLGPVERRGLFETGKRPYLWQANSVLAIGASADKFCQVAVVPLHFTC